MRITARKATGPCNAYHFPGTFYDYHWGITLARRDMPNHRVFNDPLYAKKASGPTDDGGLKLVEGDFREIQGTMWFHDHRFFFTAENVHKGNFALCNIYSGPDRACTSVKDGVNLGLPSGNSLAWGNQDFDVNLAITNPAFDKNGQLFFDIFDTDGFLGDVIAVNGNYYPYFEVLPRRYRFRILNAAMSRFIKLAVAVNNSRNFSSGTTVPIWFHRQRRQSRREPHPDHGARRAGCRRALRRRHRLLRLRRRRQHLPRQPSDADGRPPAGRGRLHVDPPCRASPPTPASVRSWNSASRAEASPASTTRRGPIPARKSTRAPTSGPRIGDPASSRSRRRSPSWRRCATGVIEFTRSNSGDSRDPKTGQCIPECGHHRVVPMDDQDQRAGGAFPQRQPHRCPRPQAGEVEYWTLVNGGTGWDHPIHLHFEEGVTLNRGSGSIGPMEKLVRKDVWRLRPGGTVQFQVRFGEFGGSYVNHCHNTVHEDFAMLFRYQLLTPYPGDPDYVSTGSRPHWKVSNTPVPSPDGVSFKIPEVLPEADPKNTQFFPPNKA